MNCRGSCDPDLWPILRLLLAPLVFVLALAVAGWLWKLLP